MTLEETAFELKLPPSYCLVYTRGDVLIARTLCSLLSGQSGPQILSTVVSASSTESINRRQYDEIVLSLLPEVASAPKQVRLQLSAALTEVWLAAVSIIPTGQANAQLPAAEACLPKLDVAILLMMFCAGSKSVKLTLLWEFMSKEGLLPETALFRLLRDILVVLHTLCLHTGGPAVREQIEDIAVEATDAAFSSASITSTATGDCISLESFAQWYNAAGNEIVPFFELLDAKNWPAADASPEQQAKSAGSAAPPKPQPARQPVPPTIPAPSPSGTVAQQQVMHEFRVFASDGAPATWAITGSSLSSYLSFLRASRLSHAAPPAILRALLEECTQGRVTADEATSAVAAIMGQSAFAADQTGGEDTDEAEASASEDEEAEELAGTSYSARHMRMRMMVRHVRSLLACLTAGHVEEGADLLDLTTAMVPYARGDKSEKLAFAWRLMEPGTGGGESMGCLSKEGLARLMRCLLIGLMSATRTGQASQEYISARAAVDIYRSAGQTGNALAAAVFAMLGKRDRAGATVSLQEFSALYNRDEDNAALWIELLDNRKLRHAVPVDARVQGKRASGSAPMPPAVPPPMPARESPTRKQAQLAAENMDLAITAVEGADVVFALQTTPVSAEEEEDVIPPLRFSSLACDLVQHVASITGLVDMSAKQVASVVQSVVLERAPEVIRTSSGRDGYGRHMIRHDVYLAIVRTLVPKARLEEMDRPQLSRFLYKLFHCLDIERVGVVDWRDVTMSLSLFAGQGGKSDKLTLAFDMYASRGTGQGQGKVTKDGLFRLYRAVFATLSAIQESSAELDLALECMLGEKDRGSLQVGEQGEMQVQGVEAVLVEGRIPDGRRVALRPGIHRVQACRDSALAFSSHTFALAQAVGAISPDSRMLSLTGLAQVYDQAGAEAALHFLELLSLRKWRPASSEVQRQARGQQGKRDVMRMLMGYAAARPLVLAALYSESIAGVEEEQAEPDNILSPRTLPDEDKPQGRHGSASAAMDAHGEEEEDERKEKEGEYEEALRQLAEDEAALSATQAEIEDVEDSIAAFQAMQEAMETAISRPVFEFRLPRASARSGNGSLTPVSLTFVLTAMDSAALQRLLHFSRLDSYEPDSLAQLIAGTAEGGVSISRAAWRTVVRRIADSSSVTLEGERAWVQACLGTLFNAFVRSPEPRASRGGGEDPSRTVLVRDVSTSMAMLCGGDKTAALITAWSLYDGDKDGKVSESELTLLLRAVLTTLFVIKAWTSLPEGEGGAPLPHPVPVLPQAVTSAIDDVAVKLGEAAFTWCLHESGRAAGSGSRGSDGSRCISFSTFGKLYNALTSGTAPTIPSALPGDKGLSKDAFLWLELMDVKKWPTSEQVNASVKEAGRAAAEAAVLELNRQREADKEVSAESTQQQEEEGLTARDRARGHEEEEEGAEADPARQGYQRLPEQEEDAAMGSPAPTGQPLFSFPLHADVEDGEGEEGEGSTRLLITDVDVYAFARMFACWPLADCTAQELVSLLADAATQEGRISRAGFEGWCDDLLDSAVDEGMEAMGQVLEGRGEGSMAARALLRTYVRDMDCIRTTLLRAYDLLSPPHLGPGGDGGVSVLDLLLPLLLLSDEGKSSKLRESWTLYAGDADMSTVELATFLSCFLRGFAAFASSPSPSPSMADLCTACLGTAMAAAESAVMQARTARTLQTGEPGEEGLSFSEFADWYNGGLAAVVAECLAEIQEGHVAAASLMQGMQLQAGSVQLPWLELLSPHKWVPRGGEEVEERTPLDPSIAGPALQHLFAHVAGGRDPLAHPFYSYYTSTGLVPTGMEEGAGSSEVIDEADVDELGTQEEAEEEVQGEQEEDEQEEEEEEEQEEEADEEAEEEAEEEEEEDEEEQEEEEEEDDERIIFRFRLSPTRASLTLASDQVHAFLTSAQAAGLAGVPAQRVYDCMGKAADGSRAGVPTLSFRAYSLAIASLLHSTGGACADMTKALEHCYRLYETCKGPHEGPEHAGVPALHLATALLPLCELSARKSNKLLAAWRAHASLPLYAAEGHGGPGAEDGDDGSNPYLKRAGFAVFIQGVLFGLACWGEVRQRGGRTAEANGGTHGTHGLHAAIIAAGEDLADTLYTRQGQQECTFTSFASWYNGQGSGSASFLELLDVNKWRMGNVGGAQVTSPPQAQVQAAAPAPAPSASNTPSRPSPARAPAAAPVSTPPSSQQRQRHGGSPARHSAQNGSAAGAAAVPASSPPDQGGRPVPAPSDPVLLTFQLAGSGGEAGYPLIIMRSDVAYMSHIRQVSGLLHVSAAALVHAMLSAAGPGAGAGTGINRDTYRKVLRQVLRLGQGEAGVLPDEAGRAVLTKAFMTLFYMLEMSEGPGAGADTQGVVTVPLADLAIGLMLLCKGSKSDKLLASFNLLAGAALDSSTASISQASFARLLRAVLTALTTYRSDAHVAGESGRERRLCEALPSLTRAMAEQAFLSSPRAQEGSMSFLEFGAWYNDGGFQAVPFLECCDYKKMEASGQAGR